MPYRVREASGAGDDLGFDLAPLVGRARELDQLTNRWEQARGGVGQAVLLSGEPGIGKSRLLRALRERVVEGSGEGAVRWLSMHGSVYTQNTPLHPVVTLLRRLLATQPGETPADQLDALLRTFALSEALPLFASLLDLPQAAESPALSAMPPERQREETLEALVALVLAMTEGEPVILLVEDLHWLDATTLTWLERLIDQAATAPLLLVMTIRPNTLDIPWGSRARVVQIALGALSSQDTEQLIQLLSGDTTLAARVQQHIVAKTDGVPLFVEELTRSMLEGGESGDWRELPTTLRDSLTARLARLGTAKEVAQLASVIGRAFSLKLLAAVAAHPVDTLERELRKLVQSGLVHRRGFGVQTRYSFKHALVRDAAYDSLLRRERQQIHLRIAAAMEDGRQAGDAAQSEEVAHHYFAGEQYAKAFERWLEAGQLAMGRSAHAEAIAHLQHGLEALNAMPASPDRDRMEIGAAQPAVDVARRDPRAVGARRRGGARAHADPDRPARRRRAARHLLRSVELLRQPRQAAAGARPGAAAAGAGRGDRRRRVAPGRPLHHRGRGRVPRPSGAGAGRLRAPPRRLPEGGPVQPGPRL